MLFIIIGCMNSGKTKKLILDYHKKNKKNSLVFLNAKKEKKFIESRGLKTKIKNVIVIKNLKDILKHIKKNTRNIFIDEFQFFDKVNINLIKKLKIKYNLHIYSLIQDYKNKNFGRIKDILFLCNKITFLKSICDKCNIRFATNNFLKKIDKEDFVNASYNSLCDICYYENC